MSGAEPARQSETVQDTEQTSAQDLARLEREAAGGDAGAQTQLGRIRLMAGDAEQARTLFEQASDQGSIEALHLLANLLYADPKADAAKAASLLLKAAEAGLADAQCQAGRMYLDGDRLKQDSELGIYWLQQACRQSHPEALFRMSQLYGKGKSVARDDAKAKLFLEKAAEGGYADAQFEMASSLLGGENPSADNLKTGFAWLKAAAMQGGNVSPMKDYGVTVTGALLQEIPRKQKGVHEYNFRIEMTGTAELTLPERVELLQRLTEEVHLAEGEGRICHMFWVGDDGELRFEKTGQLYTFKEGTKTWIEDVEWENLVAAAREAEAAPAPVAAATPEPTPEPDPLADIPLSRAQMIQAYDAVDAAINDPSGPAFAADPDWDAVDAYEEACMERIAAEYGITTDQLNTIFIYGSIGQLISEPTITLEYGQAVDVIVNGTTLIVKAKIDSQLTDRLTIDQNYYNVCDIIQHQGGGQFTTIGYWAVADMADGSEGKVISFDVPERLIQAIAANEDYPANTLGEKVEDLWILPSLQS